MEDESKDNIITDQIAISIVTDVRIHSDTVTHCICMLLAISYNYVYTYNACTYMKYFYVFTDCYCIRISCY